MAVISFLALSLALLGPARGQDALDIQSSEDSCNFSGDEGVWGTQLVAWATCPATHHRHGRIMALPPAQGYYVTDRIDHPPPHHRGPPPHHHGSPPPYHPGPPPPHHQGPPSYNQPPPGPHPYEEWSQTPPPAGSKIVNKPNKDKFKPSYPPVQRPGGGAAPVPVDRLDEPPRKQVTETDLYLLTAIEKLVYRVDLMEKRLRRMEENMHYLVVGADPKPEPCVANFSRVGSGCYHFSADTADWKSANLQCRKLRASLLELDSTTERRQFIAAMLGDKRIRGTDVWTGGLNPGLLWIWSHSARPLIDNSTTGNDTVTVVGEGRCLALVHDPALNTYVFRGQDCALRHRFVCELEEDKGKLSNEIERVARHLGDVAEGVRRARGLRGEHQDLQDQRD